MGLPRVRRDGPLQSSGSATTRGVSTVRLIAVCLLAAWTSVALVAQYRYLPTSPGTWKPWQFTAYADHRRLLGARPADVKELEAQLLRLNAIIKNTDGIT